MLTSLSIKNYALIDHLEMDFSDGLSVITGETGAGKSILLGALSLISGNRADLSSLRNKEKKCIVEAIFSQETKQLKSIFKEFEIDFEEQTIIRREILPSGKSRAFINDTPCNLTVVQAIGNQLIDIHSQHQTLELTDNEFQLQVIDAVAGNKSIVEKYQTHLKEYQEASKELEKLKNKQLQATKEQDYNTFLYQELTKAKLYDGMQEELEATYERLNNVEDIREKLAFGNQLLAADEVGTLAQLASLKSSFQKLTSFGKKFRELESRLQSVYIELDDALAEIKILEEDLESDPELLETTHTRLQLLYDLQKKHQVLETQQLIEIRDRLEKEIELTENLEDAIIQLETKVNQLEENLTHLANDIHAKRQKAAPDLIKYLEDMLNGLGMENARFRVKIDKLRDFNEFGKDELSFLFTGNKGTDFGELKKVASGGELSRIMLCIKSILASKIQLPTIMFDEIDTGVSGEISTKMGTIMKKMSNNMQVFAITHLPQVAAKGTHHYKVFKTDNLETTITEIKKLTKEDRILELAEMLGGKSLSESAMAHAKQLLN